MEGSVIGRGLLCFDCLKQEVADTARFERAGRLKIFEFEEDAAKNVLAL